MSEECKHGHKCDNRAPRPTRIPGKGVTRDYAPAAQQLTRILGEFLQMHAEDVRRIEEGEYGPFYGLAKFFGLSLLK